MELKYVYTIIIVSSILLGILFSKEKGGFLIAGFSTTLKNVKKYINQHLFYKAYSTLFYFIAIVLTIYVIAFDANVKYIYYVAAVIVIAVLRTIYVANGKAFNYKKYQKSLKH